MENRSLTIEQDSASGYKSQYVANLLGQNKIRATAIIVVNMYEDANLIQIKLVAGEFAKDDFLIEVVGGDLFLYAEKSNVLKKENFNYCSFDIDTFSKRFVLPLSIDRTAIKAQFQDGILIIDLPKRKMPLVY